MDPGTGHHRTDLADSLPDHPHQFWIRLRVGVSREDRLDYRIAIRHQPRGESDLHSHPIRDAEPTAGCRGHFDCLEHDHLVGRGDLAALPLGESGPDSLLRVGLAGNSAATVDHGVELGQGIIRLDLSVQFRDHHTKFVTTTATGIPLIYDLQQVAS